MRINQEDRPGVSDLPPPDIKKQVQKLAKRKLKDVITAILLIKNLIYVLIQIDPHDPLINLPIGIKDPSLLNLFFLFIP